MASVSRTNRIYTAVLALVICALLLGGAIGTTLTNTPDVETYIGPGSGVETASYIIFKDGTMTCAKNGTTGKIDERSSNASYVITRTLAFGGICYLSSGVYDIDYPIIPSSNVTFVGGPKSILRSSEDASLLMGNEPYFTGLGDSFGSVLSLNSSAGVGDKILNISSSTLSIGSFLELNSCKEFYNSSTNISQIVKVVEILGADRVQIEGPLGFEFSITDSASATVLNMLHNITIEGITFEGRSNTSNQFGLKIEYVEDYKITNCDFINLGYTALSVFGGYEVVVTGCDMKGSHLPGHGYGIIVGNSSIGVVVSDCTFTDCRHGSTIGGWGVSQHVDFVNCLFITDYNTQHSNGQFISYDNCRFYGESSFSIAVPYVTIKGCTFDQMQYFDRNGNDHRLCIIIGSVYGNANSNNCTIIDNTLIVNLEVHAKKIIEVHDADNLTISRNRFIAVGSKIGTGIEFLDQTTLIGNTFHNFNCHINDNYFDINGHAITTSGNLSNPVPYLSINGNDIHSGQCGILGYMTHGQINDNMIDAAESGIVIYGDNNSVQGNHITIKSTNSTQAGIVLFKGSDNNLIDSNHITAASAYAIKATGEIGDETLRNVISNNFINSQYGGIKVTYSNGTLIHGNHVSFVSYRSILIYDSNDVQLDDNQYENTTDPVYINSALRLTINNIGNNGAFDPASAGEWYGHGYERLMVTWTDGSNQTMSINISGTWIRMV